LCKILTMNELCKSVSFENACYFGFVIQFFQKGSLSILAVLWLKITENSFYKIESGILICHTRYFFLEKTKR
jgi:hypothetical protein